MRHTISVQVENKFGVLSRVAGLFSGRGYNIESISVGETLDPKISVMTIVTRGENQIVEQINKQLNKLIDVIKVQDLFDVDHVEREMVMIKITPTQEQKAEVLRLAEIFRGRVVDSSLKTYTIEITGDESKIEAFLELVKPMGVKEFVRSGKIAIARERSRG
ncbi:acetolactate synthase small subunit [Candidatus Magnetominusculus xianensis]|uniref:Acetolactate synthase small subunit n=1 Tax=Candidatus Magnetominusculus xianensis TaxID=1748249 RepID=A0ABR5SG19_9BACT|nr:acetolactate synthase small subunit [Candidatus Magnetominusculus xianensis]KWT84437.1 acetolactate synthase small subunit [Candidatus Magnetominusculus xianensis]MBF0404271.1 acetolactate synthase small subunit [Nitrospirota bacterium]